MNSNESTQSFVKLPRVLLTHPQYRKLSPCGILLYAHLLDRAKISKMNDWRDPKGNIYVYCTIEETQNLLRCGHGKASKIMSELEQHCLIVRTAQGQPHRIVVLPCDPDARTANFRLLRNSKTGRQDDPDSASNKNDTIKINDINDKSNLINALHSCLDCDSLSDIPTQDLDAVFNALAAILCIPDETFTVGTQAVTYSQICSKIWSLDAYQIRCLYYQMRYHNTGGNQQCILECLTKWMDTPH